MAGHMLDDRQDAAREQPIRRCTAERRHDTCGGPISAIADHGICASDGNIQDRHAINGYAESGDIIGNEPGAGPDGLARALPAECGEGGGGRIRGPVGRLQALDAATLLVDEHGRVRAADAIAQLGDEPSDLRRALAIALEKNEAERVGIAEEVALGARERRTGAAEDDGGGARA